LGGGIIRYEEIANASVVLRAGREARMPVLGFESLQ
jgi:hypothetical protein